MTLVRYTSINEQKKREVMIAINNSNSIIPIRIINEKTGVCYNVIQRIAEEMGYDIKKKPFPRHRKFLCIVKNKGEDNNEDRK